MSIIGLTHNYSNRYPYDDNLCLFRCLALHFGAPIHGLEETTNTFKTRLEQKTGKTYDEGVELDMLEDVETEFNIGINVYALQENKSANVVRISDRDDDQEHIMYLNVYENHFSYITKFKTFAKKFQCPTCSRLINRSENLKSHMKRCQVEIKEVYVGGKYRNKKTVFENLDSISIFVLEEDRYDPYFVVFDFEALQVPIEEELHGRTLHYEHVPATVSICSNVPDHTDPIHIRSTGDSQELVDDFVKQILEIQTKREEIMTVKYKPYMEDLEQRLIESEAKIRGISVEELVEEREKEKEKEEEEEEEEEEQVEGSENVRIGEKRKRRAKVSKRRVSKRPFLDLEAEVSDSDEDESENEDDDDDGSDLEGLINDDDKDIEENDASFYRNIDNEQQQQQQQPGPSTAPQPPPPPPPSQMIDEEYDVQMKWIKKLKAFISKLKSYIDQITILGFNSQKYDVPLIRSYLPSSLIKLDATPKQIIKKMNGYMAISTKKMKFLDITNYLAAGTSLKQFYASFQVSTPKGCFPYQWFDSLSKLDEPCLPQRTEELKEAMNRLTEEPDNVELSKTVEELSKVDPFYSVLTKKTVSTEDFESCELKWTEQGMQTFADYVRYYNNSDVIGFVEAVEKMIVVKKEKGLDMFKVSVSLPGLVQRYIFNKLDNKEDYFVGFAEEHKHLAKLLRENIVGGPSIIFHRHHERDKTMIKGKNLCKKVLGFDANSLYPYCMAQAMPTGWYCIQEEADGFKKHEKYSRQSIQWLEHVMRTKNVYIQHAENGGEKRIKNARVDGYDEENNTVYEFHGCFWHGHFCHTGYDKEKWDETLKREETIRNEGHNLVTMTSCEWIKMPESKVWYQPPPAASEVTTMKTILDDVMNDSLFGFLKVWIHTPDALKARFSEFPPLFKNTEIKLEDVGEHMQEFCRGIGRKNGVKRSLISSMYAEGILLLSPLLKWYIRMGLVVTRVELVISYYPKPVFDWFVKEGCNDRRRADLGGAELKMKGDASKTEMNCSYGRTVMNKAKHTRISFAKTKNLEKHINNPLLKNYDELNEGIYEVVKDQKRIVYDLPTQIGLAVYSYAKLRMLEFWELINTYLVNDLYQLMEMDTDSLYIALARNTIDECVKEGLREQWQTEKWKFFSSENVETKLDFEGRQIITWKQYDQRTPGKFKLEYNGDGMACLNSKVYIIWGEIDKDGNPTPKRSCKGAQQKRNDLNEQTFLHVLETQQPHHVENAGFVKDGKAVIKTYTQDKVGMSYFYAKRKVLADRVSTTHLDI